MARRRGLLETLKERVGAVLPNAFQEVQNLVGDRIAKVPTRLNEYGYDAFGLHPESSKRSLATTAFLYRHYFRAETFGIEKVPPGRVLLISNHAGQLPFDGMMLGVAMLLEAEPPRIVRSMGEYWISQLPFLSWVAERGGNLVGTPENCAALLEAQECVMVFPEGVRGMNKTYDLRYQLQRFGLGFMRLALQTDTPIVPVGIVGSEEQQPSLVNLGGLGELLGMPALPVTATFPLLGPLGLLPLPVKYRLHFGEPLRFEGSESEEDDVVQRKVDEVREAIGALLQQGRAQRSGVFR